MFQILGLILDIAGAIFLFASTELMNSIIMDMINYTINVSGKHGGGSHKVASIISKPKSKANIYAKIGLGLLVLGFGFQLVTAIQQYK